MAYHEPTPGLEDTLRTAELQARIETDLGIRINASTIRSWTLRETDPLPVAYKGTNGQAHRFRWPDFLAWYLAEEDSAQGAADSDDTEPDINVIDWHAARTISARERAKRDIMETRKLEGRYADVQAMEAAAEDRARHAVLMLRAMPSRVAPRLAAITDELEIDRILDAEIRAICQQIEQAARAAIDADLEHTNPPAEQALTEAAP